MKGPFFSVIVPAHNAEEFMRRGLDAIRRQRFADYELIIVCDACEDKTEEIAQEYTDKVLVTNYGRAGSARNDGLDIAKGEWVLFADDDDWYLDGAFGRIAETLERMTDIDVLAYGFDWKGVGMTYQRPGFVKPAVWNKAWNREFIGEDRFPDWIHTDDLGFAQKVLPRARCGFLYEVLYYYNFMRPGSVSVRIRDGEYDNSQLPESVRSAAEGYERWLKVKGF